MPKYITLFNYLLMNYFIKNIWLNGKYLDESFNSPKQKKTKGTYQQTYIIITLTY